MVGRAEQARRSGDGGRRTPAVPPYRDTSAPVLDLTHLRSMTGGDRALEAEILGLFAEQVRALTVALAADATGAATPMALHTIKGAARGVGAAEVSRLAALAEQAADPRQQAAAVAVLMIALDAALVAVQEAVKEAAEAAAKAASQA